MDKRIMCNVQGVTCSVVSPDTAVLLICTEHFNILYATCQGHTNKVSDQLVNKVEH